VNRRVDFSPEALGDLIDLYDYIATHGTKILKLRCERKGLKPFVDATGVASKRGSRRAYHAVSRSEM